MFILDCSITMAWLFEDEKTDHSDRILDALKVETAIVPPLWCLEVTNVLAFAEKKKRISAAQAIHFLETLKALPIELDRQAAEWQCESLLSLSRSYELTSYDAVYLDLALRSGYPLATLDVHLRKACKEAGVAVL